MNLKLDRINKLKQQINENSNVGIPGSGASLLKPSKPTQGSQGPE